MHVQPLSPSRKTAFDGDMTVAFAPTKFGPAVEYAQICHSDDEWGGGVFVGHSVVGNKYRKNY